MNPVYSRRSWLAATAMTSVAGVSQAALRRLEKPQQLVVLHTNDTHSYLEPFPADHPRYPGQGGAARRATLVKQIRQQHKHVLLLDSGDFFQGTPYFNFFGGEIEIKTMSALKYDVATIGNHDFDNGVKGLAKQLQHASFELVSANYDVTSKDLAPHVTPSTTRQLGQVKVGIFGLGIELSGLVLPAWHKGVTYQDPIGIAKRTVAHLKNQGCQLIICLSHLGYKYDGDKVSDLALANEVSGIDLILGGHTHTFMREPKIIKQSATRQTLIHQVGWAGLRLGRIDIMFSPDGYALQTNAGRYRIA